MHRERDYDLNCLKGYTLVHIVTPILISFDWCFNYKHQRNGSLDNRIFIIFVPKTLIQLGWNRCAVRLPKYLDICLFQLWNLQHFGKIWTATNFENALPLSHTTTMRPFWLRWVSWVLDSTNKNRIFRSFKVFAMPLKDDVRLFLSRSSMATCCCQSIFFIAGPSTARL